MQPMLQPSPISRRSGEQAGRPNSSSMCLAGVFDLLQRYAEDLREMGMTRSTINNHIVHFLVFLISEHLDEDDAPALDRLPTQIAQMRRENPRT